jgi:hypothetical protein
MTAPGASASQKGKTWAEKARGEAELTLSSNVLAPLFNGYLAPQTAWSAGLLESTGDDALDRAGRIFAVRRPPFFIDHF